MFYAKVHACAVVLCTWLCGLFIDGSVPYFPIEISRTGTGPISSLVFQWGALSIVASLWWDGVLRELPILFVWGCIVLIAWFPDQTHFAIHVLTVGLLLISVMVEVLFIGHDVERRFPILLTALAIEGARILLKGYVVLFTELDRNPFKPISYWNALWNVDGLRDEIVEHTMKIMFQGTDYAILPKLTIPVMRVTGVMQWLSLYLLMSLY